MRLFVRSPAMSWRKAIVPAVLLAIVPGYATISFMPSAFAQTRTVKPKGIAAKRPEAPKPALPKSAVPPAAPGAAPDVLTKQAWCFERIYENTHLETHPNQLTQRIWIWNRISQFSSNPGIGFSIAADVVDGPVWLGGSGTCSPAGAGLTCTLDADGSRFALAQTGGGGASLTTQKGFLLVPPGFVAEQHSEGASDGEAEAPAGAENTQEDQALGPDDTVMIGSDSDDKAMRLAAAPYAQCMTAAKEYRPAQSATPVEVEEEDGGEDAGEEEP